MKEHGYLVAMVTEFVLSQLLASIALKSKQGALYVEDGLAASSVYFWTTWEENETLRI